MGSGSILTLENLELFICGLIGVMAHALVKIRKFKKIRPFKVKEFFSEEWDSLLLSFILVVVALIGKENIKKIDQAGEYLCFAFLFIGYGGQSFFLSYFGTLEDKLNIKKEQDE